MALPLRRIILEKLKLFKVQQCKYINTASSTETCLTAKFNTALRLSEPTVAGPTSTKLSFTNSSIKISDPRPNVQPVLDLPLLPFRKIVPFIPTLQKTPVLDAPTDKEMDCPTDIVRDEKQAVRMIVIRRRKMNRHKLKKKRKRQRADCLKRRQRREIKKEKKFQEMMMDQVYAARAFDPNSHITEKLHLARTKPLPRLWKGKRLPEFLIRQLMGLDPKVDYKNIPKTQDNLYK